MLGRILTSALWRAVIRPGNCFGNSGGNDLIRLVFFVLATLNFNAQALTFLGVSGGSVATNLTTGNTPILYGGLSGPPNSACVSSGTCNSCTLSACTTASESAPICACNTSQIGGSTIVQFAFLSTTAYGTPTVTSSTTTAGGTGTITPTSAPATSAPNQTATFTTTWGAICVALGLAADCSGISSTMATGTLTVGFGNTTGSTTNTTTDTASITVTLINVPQAQAVITEPCDNNSSNAGGVCSFWAFPGDQSVYIENITAPNGWPGQQSGSVAAALAFFYSQDPTNGFKYANPTNGSAATVPLDSNGNPTNKIIGGLQNDPTTPYYFRMAVVDVANNMYYWTGDANVVAADGGNCTNAGTPPMVDSNEYYDGCLYRAFPDRVLGLLSNDFNCFIATAAFGSPMEPKINTFRAFRNRYLILNRYGRKFIDAYYHYGPIGARWIAPRPWARAAARTFLWPLWAFAYLSLKWGLQKTFIATVLGLFLLSAGIVVLAARMRKPIVQTRTN